MMTKMFVLAVCVVLLSMAEAKRDPKLFFVSTSTSTSMSTTTSMISDTLTCLWISKTKYSACTGKRRKKSIFSEDLVGTSEDISITRASQDTKIPEISAGDVAESSSNRQARFAWYYMTTTMTSVSTSTSTSTTFVSTMSVTVLLCTPSVFNGCGK